MADQTIPLQTWKIYLITNTVTKKRYVGQTKHKISRRWNNHVCDALNNRLPTNSFHNAIRKHGADAFTITQLDEVYSYTEALGMEMHYVEFYDTFGANGYNMTAGGDGSLGTRPSAETRAKQSKAGRGRKVSDETRRKMSIIVQARLASGWKQTITAEMRAKMSKASRGKPKSSEHRAKIGVAHLGMKRSPEQCAAIGASKLGMKHTPEAKAKMSAARKGVPKSPETRENMRRRWARYREQQHIKQHKLDL